MQNVYQFLPEQRTEVFDWMLDCEKRIMVLQGGTSSSKTVSALQILSMWALEDAGCTITVVGQDIPNLRVGPLKDFKFLLSAYPFMGDLFEGGNKTERVFRFKNGSMMEFNSYDNEQDAKSGKRDYLFINEANGITYEMYTELKDRTYKKIIIDYNPSGEFWVHKEVIPDKDAQLFISNFSHNQFCPETTIRELLKYKDKDPWRWTVYGLGLLGEVEGIVFPRAKFVSEFPPINECKHFGYGMDFGFSNDPTTLTRCGIWQGELYVEEVIFEIGLLDPDLDKRMKQEAVDPWDTIVADSADPKTIKSMNTNYGWRMMVPAPKGPDSILRGISLIKQYPLNIVNTSTNIEAERKNYKYKKLDGKYINIPIDKYNHSWDGIRYWALYFLDKSEMLPFRSRSMAV